MERDELPIPSFTRDELVYLQELMDGERRSWFNYKMELIASGSDATDAERRYKLSKSLRDKVYHLGGRDTLAPGKDYAEQRWWDQQHDYWYAKGPHGPFFAR